MENETVEEKLERVMAERDFALDALCEIAGDPFIANGYVEAERVYVFVGRDLEHDMDLP